MQTGNRSSASEEGQSCKPKQTLWEEPRLTCSCSFQRPSRNNQGYFHELSICNMNKCMRMSGVAREGMNDLEGAHRESSHTLLRFLRDIPTPSTPYTHSRNRGFLHPQSSTENEPLAPARAGILQADLPRRILAHRLKTQAQPRIFSGAGILAQGRKQTNS